MGGYHLSADSFGSEGLQKLKTFRNSLMQDRVRGIYCMHCIEII